MLHILTFLAGPCVGAPVGFLFAAVCRAAADGDVR